MYPSEFGERNFGASGDFLFVPLGRPLEGTNLSGSGSKSSGSLPTLAPPLEKPPPREGEKRDDGSSISYFENEISVRYGRCYLIFYSYIYINFFCEETPRSHLPHLHHRKVKVARVLLSVDDVLEFGF